MTDLAVFAGSGAIVTVAVAIGMLVLGLRASDAEKRCADALVDAANRKAQTAIDATTIASMRNELASEKARADVLDDELAKASANPDPAGAMERVLSSWRAAHASARGNTLSVPPPRSSEPPERDGLIDPERG